MKIYQFDYPIIPKIEEEITLCLGFFDGIHLGHKEMIQKARNEGYKVGLLTFDETPAFVLGNIKENHYLTSVSDKAEILEELGIDYFLIMHFDLSVAELTKDEFIDNVIKAINPKKIYCGEDYTFGVRGEGNGVYLSYFFDTTIIPLVKKDNKKVSSRDISVLIEKGKIEDANELLGRPYRLNGLVVEGKHNGKKIDFPTANLKLDYPYAFPKSGVYFGYAYVYGDKYKAIVSVGTHPTIMRLEKPIIEVHIIDFNGYLYGKDIFLELIHYHRDEKTFDSLDALKTQLESDKKAAIKYLK
ncbi:MAG: riboflavin biosynthesis protein RibF [Bacilli bacterium]|nr:riboflavin biosynthesis protein RibF [Bacilli bacterium]